MSLQEINTPKVAVGGNLELINKRRRRYTDEEALELVQRGSLSETATKDPAKRALERLWFRCVSWYIGQNTNAADALFYSHPDLADLVAEPDSSYSANHIMPLVLRQVARLSQNDGKYEALPKTPDHADKRAAKVAERIWHHFHRELDFKSVRSEVAFWAVICGTGFGLVEWDPDHGEKRRRYSNPFGEDVPLEPEHERFLESMGEFEDVAEGDLILEAISPFQVTVPGDFTRLETMPWLILERVRSIDWLHEHYPEHASKIQPQDLNMTMSSQYWRRLASIVRNSGFAVGGLGSIVDNESVIIREFWRPPSAMVKDGARIVACNGQLLANEPHPQVSHGVNIRFPLRMMRYALAPGRFWGVGMVEHLIGPQAEYNRAREQLSKHRDQANKAKWLADRGAELTPTPNGDGEVWEKNPNARVDAVVPPALSQAHVLTPEMALQDMRLIASQSEVSQGQTPPNVRSGVAIRALQERDVETVGYAFEQMEAFCGNMASDALEWAARFMTLPRAIRLYGENRAGDILYFTGADMRGNTRVIVQPRSMAPRSRAAAMENVFTMVELGLINPQDPEDRRYALHTLEVGELDDTFSFIDANVRRAQEENELFFEPRFDLVTGMMKPMPDVQPHDDHQIHLREHTRAQLSDRWEQTDPAIKMYLLAHNVKHQQEMLKALLAAQQLGAGQQQNRGSPPKETGKPSPPKREATQA